jgi:GntR family transcriptional regulator/MocR family aminotransferase
MAIPVETFFLDPHAQATLQARIQQMISQGILSGRFRPGEKLPSSRKLAAHLGVSRITVTLAYTELVASDYLTAQGRSGYFVSENAPEPMPKPNAPPTQDRVDWARAIGQRFTGGVAPEKPQDWARYRYPFIYGQADPTLFDHANWRLCALQALGQKDFAALTTDYYDQDDPQLVEFIARHTLPRRGIVADTSQILVTLGAQNALWLAAQVLLTQRRTAAVEDPCYPALRDILTQSR